MLLDEIVKYKYGFKYKGVLYGWKNKKLYKLPYTKNKRSYKLKEILFSKVVNIQRTKLTLKKIEFLTEEINFFLTIKIDNKMPF